MRAAAVQWPLPGAAAAAGSARRRSAVAAPRRARPAPLATHPHPACSALPPAALAGAVLEPDNVDGRGLLQALRAAKAQARLEYAADVASGACDPAAARFAGGHAFAVGGGRVPL